MLDNYGFDLWADGYEKTVQLSDENNEYPFAGYKKLLNAVYSSVMIKASPKVLDIGIGTGVLSSRLYEAKNEITGIDFSDEMLKISKEKMPHARLIKCDISKGLPTEIKNEKFDFVISTYAFHHLTEKEKPQIILSLLKIINENGLIIIGDVSFKDRNALNKCMNDSGKYWDGEEIYIVFDEFERDLKGKCRLDYSQISHCAGIVEIENSI